MVGTAQTTDNGRFACAVAERFSDAWEPYWATRALPWEGLVADSSTIARRSDALVEFTVRTLFEADDDDDDLTGQALVILTMLADDLVLLDAATSTESEFDHLGLLPRSELEALVVRTGVADLCARLASPLTDSHGATIRSDDGPFQEIDGNFVYAFRREFGFDAEPTAPEARQELRSTVTRALPICRGALDRLHADAPFERDYRAQLARLGADLIRAARTTGPSLVAPLDFREISDSDRGILMQLFAIGLIGRLLRLLAAADSTEQRASLPMFDTDDLALIDHDPEPA